MSIWCGIDWASDHHDVALVDDDGKLIAKRRLTNDPAGFRRLLELLAEHGAGPDSPVPIAIETAQGLFPAAVLASGYPLFAINPLAASRYRDRHAVSGSKSDAGDALVLANILRTDQAQHRQVPDDSELVRSLRVLARAQQDAVWDRQRLQTQLRAVLHDYFPAALAAFPDLSAAAARDLLLTHPRPGAAARLRRPTIRAAVVRGGRQRNIDREVDRIVAGLRSEQLHQPELVEAAMAQHASALLRALDTAVSNELALQEAMTAVFTAHQSSTVILSFPGLGPVLGSRLLAELGDDSQRFQTARGLKAFAGTAPITRASGSRRAVTTRVICNKRLTQVGYLWALSLLTASPGARAHYQRRRDQGDNYSAAARNLANRYFGLLHHCLQTGQPYDESKAFPTATPHMQAA